MGGMSQQPFSRPGAVDLSALTRPAPGPSTGGAASPGAAGGGGGYSTVVTDQNFQQLVESSMTAPVMLVFYSPTTMPESQTLARDLETLAPEFQGGFVLGTVDVDEQPSIAQAMQIPSIPLVVLVLQGRPMPLFQDVAPLEELRTAVGSVMDQVAAQGMTGRHAPFPGGAEPEAVDEDAEPPIDPRYVPAQDALERGDLDGAVAEYQKLLDTNPADAEAAGGLAMARLLRRTQGVDLAAARSAAAERPDDVDAQTLAADLDLLGGHVEDAFLRLIGVVARSSDKQRDAAREHLIGLFAAVGNEDPRVRAGRMKLASALF